MRKFAGLLALALLLCSTATGAAAKADKKADIGNPLPKYTYTFLKSKAVRASPPMGTIIM